VTQYLWLDPDNGGDWNDPNNWETLTQPPPVGPPGPGDDVVINLHSLKVITTDGASVDSISGGGAILMGDLAVADDIGSFVLSGGAVTVGGDMNYATFNGTTLSAGAILGGTMSGGTVTTGEFAWGNVAGATVSAGSLDPEANTEVDVIAGTLSAKSMDLDLQYAALVVSGGTATIGSAVSLNGPTDGAAGIFVSGGQLSLKGGLTLDGGAFMNDGSVPVASAGGVVTTPELTVGGTGSGRVYVGNSAAHLSVTSDFILGESGSGLLTVENGGHVTVGGNMESAVKSGSTATGTISDADADLTFDQDWEIGVAGAAAWTLDGAVSATVAGLTELGVSSGGSGTLTLSDGGTVVVPGGGGVIVGVEGQGTVTVQSGGVLDDAGGELTVAEAEKSKGLLQLNDAGSKLIVGANAIVGAAGSGSILIDGGGATLSGTLKLGESKGATGALTVNGGVVTFSGDMTVGESGTGSVNVGPDGGIERGTLRTPTGSTDTITLGAETTGKGTLTVSGSDAAVESIGLTVGGAGGGTLSIAGYGKVTTTGDATVGAAATATIQKVTVTSAGSWIVGADLILGKAAIATTSVTSGGLVQVADSLILGAETGATGIMILSGGLTTGSSTTLSDLRWGDILDVGEAGTGNLTISAGAVAKSSEGAIVEIASSKGAVGTLTLGGAQSELSAKWLADGGALTAAGGAGTMNLGSGGVADFADGGVVWAGGKATIEGELDTAGTLKMAGDLTVGGASSGARAVVGTGTLALTGGTTALDTGAALTIAKVAQSGTAAVTLAATGLRYAGVWTQVGGSISVDAGDTLAFTGAGDSFTGILTGSGRVEFAGGTDSLSGVALSAASTVIDGAAVTLAAAIDLTKTLTVTSPKLTIAAAGASLSGGGTLELSSLATNRITGVTAAAALTNVDDRIVGAGDIGGGAMTLTNDASGSIIGDSATVALTLDTGSKAIGNAGLIVSEAKGGVTIKSAVANTGKLEVTAGTLTVSGAVTGTGSTYIVGGTADFLAAFSENVAFTGTTGVLELAKSQSYAGKIKGFSLTGGTSLDLGDIGFTSGTTKATFAENSAKTEGVLTVTDGTHTAHITLVGDYASSTFTTSSDGHGGTIVVDPQKTPAATASKSGAVLSFVNAMAGFDADAGQAMTPTADPGPSPQPLLTVSHPSGRGAMAANWA